MSTSITVQEESEVSAADLNALYTDAKWSNYTKDLARLQRGLSNSHLVVTARQGKQLIGLLRAISDGETIAFIQDILVLQQFQRQQVGTRLVAYALEKYATLRQVVLLTDDQEPQHAFYQSLGFKQTSEWKTQAYLKINES